MGLHISTVQLLSYPASVVTQGNNKLNAGKREVAYDLSKPMPWVRNCTVESFP